MHPIRFNFGMMRTPPPKLKRNSFFTENSIAPNHQNSNRKLSVSISVPFQYTTYYREVPASALSYDNEKTWLVLSIVSTILFLPFLFLWLPALIASIISSKNFMNGNYIQGNKNNYFLSYKL